MYKMIKKLIYHTLSSTEDIVFIRVTLHTGCIRYVNVRQIAHIDDEYSDGAIILMTDGDYFQVKESAEDIIKSIFSGCELQ